MKTTTVAGRTWHYSHYIGRSSAEHNESKYGRTGGFIFPMDVVFGDGDVLFAVSRGWGEVTKGYIGDVGCRIGKMTIDEDHIGDFARAGFTWPVALAVASDGNVYCSDEHECIISVFDPDAVFPFPEGKPGEEALSTWGVRGAAPGQLDGPSGIAFDASDNLYVVDGRNDRVQVFTKDGQFVGGWGRSGAGEGELSRPWGITVDAHGDVYVADSDTSGVIKRFNGTTGALIETFISDSGNFDEAFDIDFGPDGNLYVSDLVNAKIVRYQGPRRAGAGTFIDTFISAGGSLTQPAGIEFGADGDLYICNFPGTKVLRYEGPNSGSPGTFVSEFMELDNGRQPWFLTQHAPPTQFPPPSGLLFTVH